MKFSYGPRVRCFALIALTVLFSTVRAHSQADNYLFNDSHFHLTNYIQEGTNIHDFVNII